MRREPTAVRTRRLCVLLVPLTTCILAACGGFSSLTQPEGDGGWSTTRRRDEIEQRAGAAGVEVPNATPSAGEAAPEHPAPVSGPLDLPTALRLTLSGNRQITEAKAQVETARDTFLERRGRLLPASLGSARYTRYSDPQSARVSLPPAVLASIGTQPEAEIRDSEAAVFNGTLTLPLDLSGEIRHALAAAQAGYRGEQARLWATTLDQQVAVVRAYFELLEALRLREVTAQTVTLDRQQVANAESRFANGRVTKNQLLVVQVALQDAEQRLLQRAVEIDRARWALNEAVGLAVNAPTEPVDVRERPDVPSVADALQLAEAHNPVLASLLEEQQRLDENARALERSRFPRFSAGGAIDYSTSDLVQPQRIESGFAGFTWDLGTDTRREADIAAAHVAADKNHAVLERTLRDIEAAIRVTHSAAQERLAALATAEVAVGQAEENLRIRQQQFDVGRATSEDVLDAEARLSQQRATLATALYQAHTRRAELQQLIGLPLDDASAASR